jgi:hypothetical protein
MEIDCNYDLLIELGWYYTFLIDKNELCIFEPWHPDNHKLDHVLINLPKEQLN